MSIDQLLVTLCVFAAGAYLASRQWRRLRSSSAAKSCGGGCGCAKSAMVPPHQKGK
jgi:hypothetical protein